MKLLKFHIWGICLCCAFSESKGQLTVDFDKELLIIPGTVADSGCIPDMIIQFFDRSTFGGNPLAYYSIDNGNPFNSHHWDFGHNGHTSTARNPVYGYFTPGSYNITLTVTQDGITYDSITKSIYVFQPPSPRLSVSPARGCDPLTVTFTNNSFSSGSSICKTLVDFGDGVIETKTGAQALDPFTHTYHMLPQQRCWKVTMIVTDCRGCDSAMVYPDMVCISSPPAACFTPSDTVLCSHPFNLTFRDCSVSDNPLAYRWDFGDGTSSTQRNPAKTYSAMRDSTYTVRMTVTDTQCGDTAVAAGTVATRRVEAKFVTSTPVECANAPISFHDDGSIGTGLSYTWDFGDGGSGSGPDVQHTYATPDTFTVTLVVRDGSGTCSDTITKPNLIRIISGPSAAFTATPTTYCSAPLDVSFTYTGGATGISYLWSFGTNDPADTSTVRNPVFTYEDPGTYDVILEVTNLTNGCTNSTVANDLIVIEELTAAFAMDPRRGCSPLSVDFYNTSDPQFVNFEWDFGDSTGSYDRDPTHIFVGVDTYAITLITTTADGGCTGTVTDTVIVGEKLLPEFASDSAPFCVNEEVVFSNLTDISGVPADDTNDIMWNWTFEGAPPISGTGPLFSGPHSRFWDEPNEPGDSTDITLEVCYNGCCADTTMQIMILEPKAEFYYTQTCANQRLVSVRDSTRGANRWEWDFGDGTNPVMMPPQPYADSFTHLYAGPGIFDITLTAEDTITGCLTEMVKQVTIVDLNADFVADDTEVCVGDQICFENESTDQSRQEWNFGDGSPVNALLSPCHTYTSPGIYSVKLVVYDHLDCKDSLVRQNYIRVHGVTADFVSPDPYGCIPPTGNDNTITFNDSSFASPGSVVREWHWTFGESPPQDYINGNGPPSVTHIYSTAGVYTVSLRVVSDKNCENTVSLPNYVDVRKPVACFDFPYQIYCEDQPVPITHCSQGGGLNCQWDFGDNSPLDPNCVTSHVYADSGCYDLTLHVTDANGCTSSYHEDSAFCIQNPEPKICADSTYSVCPPHIACFDTCFDFNGIPIKRVLWDFGDGSFSEILDPCHIYVEAGKFEVTFYVEFDNYCLDTLVRKDFIFVGGATGEIIAEPDTGCVPMNIVLNAQDSGAVSRFWLTPWDQISGVIGGSIIHSVVREPGVWQPAVVLTDAQHPVPCSYILYADFDLLADTVYANFGMVDTVCREEPVQFTDSSSALIDTNINRWIWNFGDNSLPPPDTVNNPVHYFQKIGLDTVCLTAYNGFNCEATICKTIFIRDRPTAGFTISDSSGCDTLLVQFFDTSKAGVNAVLSDWLWDYGVTTTAADTSNVQSPSFYNYQDTGRYQPSLIVKDADGCEDTAMVTINVYKTPDGIYNNDTLPLCFGDTVQLLTDSLYESYHWTPGTALSNDTIPNPLAFPADTISYVINITEAHGCDKQDTVTINVIPLPPLTVTPHPDTIICYSDTIQLNATGGSNHQWSPDIWMSDPNVTNPFVWPGNTITYRIINEGIGGCTNNDSIRVIVSRLVANFIGERSCFGDVTDFIDFSTRTDLPIISWQWDFGTNPPATSNVQNPVFTYSTADSFLAQLVISDAIGCTDTATQIVIIDTPATAVAGYDTTICFGETVQLFSSGGDTVFWTPLPIDSPNVFNPWVTPSSTTVYTAHITNGVCPYDLADVVITVIPPPDIQTIDNTTILRGESIELTTTVDRHDSILWVPSDSLSCVTCLSPIASPWVETTYIITVIDEFGCVNSTEVTIDVEVQCKEDQVWVANAFMPKLAVHEENRVIQVRLRGVEKLNYFRIYDRWGKLMFETDDENEKWDGTNLDGQELNGGVYVYVCEAVCWYQNKIVKTGNITLIR